MRCCRQFSFSSSLAPKLAAEKPLPGWATRSFRSSHLTTVTIIYRPRSEVAASPHHRHPTHTLQAACNPFYAIEFPASMTTVQELPNMAPTSSVSPTPTVTPTHSNSVSRRPPRKSTLTQQQKNQKRQRATQDQLVTLEMEFNKNPTPTAVVRERIAQEINMTERSVQIWFQNRYEAHFTSFLDNSGFC